MYGARCSLGARLMLAIQCLSRCSARSVLGVPILDSRYIGFADMENAYRYRLSVSADMVCHIGSITDILNWVDDLFSWMIFDKRFRDFRIFFSDRVVW